MFFSAPSFAVGFATGFGTGFLTREIARVGQAAIRPAAKAMIKSSMTLVERGREALAVAGETFEDLVAEARSDLATDTGVSGELKQATKASGSTSETATIKEKASRSSKDKSGAEVVHHAEKDSSGSRSTAQGQA